MTWLQSAGAVTRALGRASPSPRSIRKGNLLPSNENIVVAVDYLKVINI